MPYLNLEQKIIKKFKLFQGLRPEAEEQKIFAKVYNLCFDEMVLFLCQHLSQKDQESLTRELESAEHLPGGDAPTNHLPGGVAPAAHLEGEDRQNQKNLTPAGAVLVKYLESIENSRFKLDKRLDYFLNNLLYQAVENKAEQP